MPCVIPPLDQTSTRIGRGYGSGAGRTSSARQMHAGFDFIGARGTPIVAPIDGQVFLITNDVGPDVTQPSVPAEPFARGQVRGMSGYGNAVVLKHTQSVPGLPTPFFTLYAHMRDPSSLRLGQSVQRGTLIGYVGNTTNGQYSRLTGESIADFRARMAAAGKSTREMGQHLHMEVRTQPPPTPYGAATIDPARFWDAVGYDWRPTFRDGDRPGGGSILARVGGPSDCRPALSGLGQCCGGCPHGWRMGPCPYCRSAAVEGLFQSPTTDKSGTSTTSSSDESLPPKFTPPSPAVDTTQYVDPNTIKTVYSSKGSSAMEVTESDPSVEPPDYSKTVGKNIGSGLTPVHVAIGVAGLIAIGLIARR